MKMLFRAVGYNIFRLNVFLVKKILNLVNNGTYGRGQLRALIQENMLLYQ